MKKLYALPLAALAFAAACDDSSQGLFSPEGPAGGPNFHHRAAPTTINVAVSGQDATVSWNAVDNAGGYGVQITACADATCSEAPKSPSAVVVSGTSYTATGLAVGTYYARVNAHNGADGGPNDLRWSAWSQFSIVPASTSPRSSTPVDERVTQSIQNFSMPTGVVYGAHNQTFSPTATSGLAVTLTVLGQCTLVDDSNEPVSSAIAPASVKITGAGECAVTATQAGTAPYTGFHAVSVTDEFAIAQKELTVTARNESKDYDGRVFSGGYSSTIAGFVNGEGASVITGSVTNYTGTAIAAVNAGTYAITPDVSGLSALNYFFSPVNGTLTINKVNATISVQGYTGIWDGNAHGATGSATGVNGEDLNSLLSLGASFTAVPGGTANWTFAGNTNYNSDSGSVQITIAAWTTKGFYSPVNAPSGAFNVVKAGSTVPLKFNLFAGTTEKISTSDVGGFAVVTVSCTSATGEDQVEFTTTGGTSLRYSGTPGVDGQFVQNWQTPSKAGCYKATVTAKDGTPISALFRLR